jgi:cytochrome c oxidase assembly protein subunit 15
MILSLVAVGGITRLTGSGLSIVEWKPIMGAIPPLNELEWEQTFALYQQSPQFRLTNSTMTIEGFKLIFFWEYLHRLLARLIGLVFLVPWLVFIFRGQLRGKTAIRVGIAFALGGLQGLLGWIMVKSGLIDRPSVSHYRLAAHLLLALLVMTYLLWIFLDLRARPRVPRESASRSSQVGRLSLFLWGLTPLFILQTVYGAFVAGLKAGFGFNTFPRMNADWVPSNFLWLQPAWLNFFENGATVQFVHRWLGTLLLLGVTAWGLVAVRLPLSRDQRLASNALLFSIWAQYLLGVGTLIFIVPIPLAVTHQVGAAITLAILTWTHHSLTPFKPASGLEK